MKNRHPIPKSIQEYLVNALSKLPIEKYRSIPQSYQKLLSDKSKLRSTIAKADIYKVFELLNICGINWGVYFIGDDIDLKNEAMSDDLALSLKSISRHLKNSSSFITSGKLFAEISGTMAMASELAYMNKHIGISEMSLLESETASSPNVANRRVPDSLDVMLSIFENQNMITTICKKFGMVINEFYLLSYISRTPFSAKSQKDISDKFNNSYLRLIKPLYNKGYLDKVNNKYVVSTSGMVAVCNIIGEFMIYSIRN
jgi:hypothetical protein